MSYVYLFICFIINWDNTNIKDINDCESDPCTHGSCLDGVRSYTCVCDAGYTGANCNKGTQGLIYVFIYLVHNKLQQY